MKKAFTLIELLIVIAIIAILAGVIFVNLNSARNRAKDAQVKSDLSEFSKALEILKVDRDLVNTSWNTLGESAAGTTDASIPNWKDVDGNPLLAKLPTHPISGGAYRVRIWTPSNYALLSRLSKTNDYWCIRNGSSYGLTASSLTNAQNDCDG